MCRSAPVCDTARTQQTPERNGLGNVGCHACGVDARRGYDFHDPRLSGEKVRYCDACYEVAFLRSRRDLPTATRLKTCGKLWNGYDLDGGMWDR